MAKNLFKKIRVVLKGLEGVQQIKVDIVVHSNGEEHDRRFEALILDI